MDVSDERFQALLNDMRDLKGWGVNHAGQIRLDDCCPLTAKFNMGATYWQRCGHLYGFNFAEKIAIVKAADGQGDADPLIRAALIGATDIQGLDL